MIEKKPHLPNLVAGSLIALISLAACGNEPAATVPAASPEEHASTCAEKGALQAVLSGAISTELDWADEQLRCESMPRPGAEGVRLRFSGEVGAQQLAIIIALPALRAGETGTDFDGNVTISVEGSGRFFSTPNLATCWAAIVLNEPVSDSSDTHNVMGGLSCVGPLGEINGDGFVDIQMLRFSGIANWSKT